MFKIVAAWSLKMQNFKCFPFGKKSVMYEEYTMLSEELKLFKKNI